MEELKLMKASSDDLDEVLAFAEKQMKPYSCSARTKLHIKMVTEEVFVNIARYAYEQEHSGPAVIQAWVEGESPTLVLTFMDCGIPYNPLEKEDPDVTLAARKRRIGGLGIYMVKKSVDDIQYEYRDGKNILTIRKRME